MTCGGGGGGSVNTARQGKARRGKEATGRRHTQIGDIQIQGSRHWAYIVYSVRPVAHSHSLLGPCSCKDGYGAEPGTNAYCGLGRRPWSSSHSALLCCHSSVVVRGGKPMVIFRPCHEYFLSLSLFLSPASHWSQGHGQEKTDHWVDASIGGYDVICTWGVWSCLGSSAAARLAGVSRRLVWALACGILQLVCRSWE